MNQPVEKHLLVGLQLSVRWLLGLLFGCMFCAMSAGAAAPTIQELVAQFSPTNYLNIISNKLYTRQGMSRNIIGGTTNQHDLARDAIYAEFQNLGYTPMKDSFYYESNGIPKYACNIIAVKEGVYNPSNEIYVVVSHYDSKYTPCPGADDNGTGVACQLEMARIFQPYNFAKTLVFLISDGEEDYDSNSTHHRLGATRYVNQHYNDNIKGVISADMFGWQSPYLPNTATLAARPASAPVCLDLQAALQTYGGLAVDLFGATDGTGDNNSDHYAFEQAGIPGCLLIEGGHNGINGDVSKRNPNYHKATDYVELPGYLDWTYIEKVCKSVIGYYAEKLQLVDIRPTTISIQRSSGSTNVLYFSGLFGNQYVVDYTTNLTSPIWTPIITNAADLATGLFGVMHTPPTGANTGFYRARFHSGYTGPTPWIGATVDNVDATVVGTWSTSTFSFNDSDTNKFMSDFRYTTNSASGTNYVEFRPNLQIAGQYTVYERHPTSTGDGGTLSTNTPVTVVYNGGTTNLVINQQINNGAWVLLGTFSFAAGTNGYVRIKNNAASGTRVMADAIKFFYGVPPTPPNAPQIVTQPRNRTADVGTSAAFTAAVAGTAPLTYRWYFNSSPIGGATGSTYTIPSVQTNLAGGYSLVVSNSAGSVTSRVATLTVYSAPQSVLFADSFDADTSGNWLTHQSSSDTRVTFNYDYSADGIPSAPHSTGGTTRGVKFEANMTSRAVAAVSMSPTGQSFTGDYRLRFDMWINANGPFPAGGNGSTQHGTAGVGTSGDHLQWTGTGNTADGYWFAADGEGQGSIDYGAYTNGVLLSGSSGVYAGGSITAESPYYTAAFPGGQTAPAWQQANYGQQTGALAAGTIGFAWCDVVIAKKGNTVEWYIDGVKLATFTNTTFNANNIFVGYWDQYPSVSDNSALSFGLIDNLRVEVPAP